MFIHTVLIFNFNHWLSFNSLVPFDHQNIKMQVCLNIYDLLLDPRDLALSRRRPISYRNQSIALQSKPMDWFLYDIGLRRENVKS